MTAKLPEKIGFEFEPYTFKIEEGKIRELALAIGDNREDYITGSKVPPTFATVIEFRLSQNPIQDQLGLPPDKILHGEQEYEYVGNMRPGDEISVRGFVQDAYTKANMNFYVVKREFTNQHSKLVLLSTTTIIERL
jgi:hypothetical protein